MTAPPATAKTIWTAWLQGPGHEPELVRRCFESWQRHNPSWQLVVLDAAAAEPYWRATGLPLDWIKRMPLQKQSNLLRMRLLTHHGGVWADATTFCLEPLDSWMPLSKPSGFFCFRNPGPDRMVANWFMAAGPSSPLAILWRDAYEDFWRDFEYFHHGAETKYPWWIFLVSGLMNRALNWNPRWTDVWLDRRVRRHLRTYPYYIMHYAFAHGWRRSAEWQRLFAAIPDRAAAPLIAPDPKCADDAFIERAIAAAQQRGLPMVKFNSSASQPS
jgi:hypothetical protein